MKYNKGEYKLRKLKEVHEESNGEDERIIWREEIEREV